MCKMSFGKIFLLAVLSVCFCDDEVGYDLNIGNAINIFANYGDLCQVTQVVSSDYEVESEEEMPFAEKNLKIFENVSYMEDFPDLLDDKMQLMFCNNIEELLERFFINFNVEGTDKAWKAFMGDWNTYDIMRTFGIEIAKTHDNCCYVLAKLSKTHQNVQLEELPEDLTIMDYVENSIESLNITDTSHMRQFMKDYGTHYINSYRIGNAVYQVFQFKRTGFNMLKSYAFNQTNRTRHSDNLRYYFSSLFLKQVGDIRVASGNKTIEKWAKKNLRDSQYLYSRPTILRLYYSTTLVKKLEDLLDNGALLSLDLKLLRPIFKNKEIADRYSEIVDNDLKLWEVNT